MNINQLTYSKITRFIMKRSILRSGLLLAGIITVAMCNSFSTYAQSTAPSLDAATLLTRSEAYDKAADMFKTLIAQEPGNSKLYFFYGENWLQDYFSDTISNSLPTYTREAKALYEKGVTANPGDPLNYVGLARVAFLSGDNKTADEMRAKARSFLLPFKNIKRIVPPAKEYAFTLAKLAESFISVDFKVDTSKALPLIREALKIDPKSRDIYLITGDIFNLVNDGSNSIKNYNLAQDWDPTSPTAVMKIGSIYVRARNLNAAIPYFEEAIRLNANYAPAYRELGALYSMARRYDQSKEYFQKYLDLTAGNIPAMISYVRSLYFAGEYDEVISRIEEIFKVDQSKAYLNRLAAYSSYEKKDADYDKALHYMDALFKNVSPELIIKRDYLYLAKILMKRNQDYPNLLRDNDRLKLQLEREMVRYNGAPNAATKAKMKPAVDTLNARIARNDKLIAAADKEIDRAFGEYAKALTFDPEDQALLNEMATAYYNNRRYEMAARTWAKLIPLGKNQVTDFMRVGRAYYVAEKYQSADSIFTIVTKMDPAYIEAYLYLARNASKREADPKEGRAKRDFENLIGKAQVDSVKNSDELVEAFNYLAYHYLLNNNYTKCRDYYMRMINIDPSNKDFMTRGYNSLANLEYTMSTNEKTLETKIPYINKAIEWYNKIIALDPGNEAAKASAKSFTSYRLELQKGINPNELKGTVRNAAGQPVANASIRVKDTAAETYSNATGAFKFEIPQASEALLISAAGYKTQEIPVTRPLKALTIVLEQ